MNLLRIIDILFVDEIGQLRAGCFATREIIFFQVRESDTFMGGIIVISIMDHSQLQPASGRPFLISSHLITCYMIMKLETLVRAFGDMLFQRLQQIIQMHYIVLSPMIYYMNFETY